MKKRKRIIAGSLLCIAIGGVALKGMSKEEAVVQEEVIQTVKTIQLTPKVYPKTLDYLGYVKAEDTKRYAFLSGGQLEEVYVEEGQYVKAGDELARLDTTQLEFAEQNTEQNIALAKKAKEQATLQLAAAKEALEAEQVTLEKIQEEYENGIYALEKQLKIKKDNLEVTKALLEIGGASVNDYNTIQTDYDVSVEELEKLKNNKERDLNLQQIAIENAKLNVEKAELAMHDIDLNQAEIARNQTIKNIKDALLVADRDGYVIYAPYEAGEVVAAGAPIVSLRSEQVLISMALSVEDYEKISKETKVLINGEIEGKIDTISSYPDEATKMYTVEISLQDQSFTAGEIVDVALVIGEEEGFFLPLDSIFEKEGLDYVYTVDEEGKLVQSQVIVEDVKENEVKVSGLEENTAVVIEGIKSLKENQLVKLFGSEE